MATLKIHKHGIADPDCLWLQNHSTYNKIGRYNHNKDLLEIIDKQQAIDFPDHTVGFFDLLSENLVGFYRHNNHLFLLLNSTTVVWSDDIQIELSFKRDLRYLVIKQDDTVLAHYVYSLDRTQIFENDPTPFIEDEDFDFGLFLINIANDPGRKLRLSGFNILG